MSNFKEKAREEGIDVYKLKIGQNKIKCPKCSSDRKNKFDRSLSVEYSNDGIVWTCHHCGWQGGLNDNFTKKEPIYKCKTICAKRANNIRCRCGMVE